MSENAAGEISSPYTSMLYISLFSWVKIWSEDESIKITGKRYLQIQH